MEVFKKAGGWSTSAGYGLLVVYMWAEDLEENNVVCRRLSDDEYGRLFDPNNNGEFEPDALWNLEWYTLFLLRTYTPFLQPCYKPKVSLDKPRNRHVVNVASPPVTTLRRLYRPTRRMRCCACTLGV